MALRHLTVILLWALVAPAQEKQATMEPIRETGQAPQFGVRVNLVSLDVEVLDRTGDSVTALTRGDFIVKEEGKEMEISHFAWLSDRPVSLVFVLDTSAVPREQLSIAKDFISRLSHLLAREDEIALFTFDNRDAYLEQEFTCDRGLILEALSNIDVASGRVGSLLRELFGPIPRTGLGIDLALHKAHAGVHEKKAVLVVSNRLKGLGPVTIDHLRDSGHTLLTLKFSNKTNSVLSFVSDRISRRQLLRESGGRRFSGDKEDIARTCRAIAWSLKNHYSLGYTTTPLRDGERRSLEVLVPGYNYRIHVRRSYGATR